MRFNALLSLCSLSILALLSGEALAAGEPLTLTSQGGRPFGGTARVTPDQGSIHCDHGYVEWQIPADAKTVPLLMIHASSTRPGRPPSTAARASRTFSCAAAFRST